MQKETEEKLVARDRIELPTRGFSVPVTPSQAYNFNHLAG